MAQPVVDLFEAIKVEHQNRELFIAASQSRQGAFEAFIESNTVREMCKRVLPNNLLGFQEGYEPLCEFERMVENAAQEDARIYNDQNRNKEIDEITAPANTNSCPQDDGSNHGNRRDWNGCESKCATGQHSGTQAGYNELPAVCCVRKKTYWNDRP